MTGNESGSGVRNVGDRFDRLPATDVDRRVEGRPTREAVVSFFEDRYGINRETFAGHSFWERGSGNVWAFYGNAPSPTEIQGLGMHVLRTDGEHWKPTTNGVQRFAGEATRNVLVLDAPASAAFVRGDDQAVDWDGDWGYLVVAREVAGDIAPLGVGLYVDGVLRSQIPKGRRRDL